MGTRSSLQKLSREVYPGLDIIDQNLVTLDDPNTFTATLTCDAIKSNYIRFATGDYSGLSLSTKTDANADSGFTMADNTFHQVAALGDATNAFVLPEASVGSLTVFRFTGQYDGGANAGTWTTKAGDFYAAQTLNTDVTNFGDAQPGSRRIFGTDFTQTVATHGGAIITIVATHNTLTIVPTATNNQTNIGAELAFYCEVDGFWRLSFKASELGSGALNGTFATSTA
jgi:hypothetical protein